MIGRLLGSGDLAGARSAARRMVEIGAGAGVLFGVAILALHGVLPHLFTDDPRVVTVAGLLLVWVGLMQPLSAVVFVLDGVLMGAGDMRFLAQAMVGAAAVFAAAACALIVTGAGVGWLWAALTLLTVARLAALTARVHGNAWLVPGPTR